MGNRTGRDRETGVSRIGVSEAESEPLPAGRQAGVLKAQSRLGGASSEIPLGAALSKSKAPKRLFARGFIRHCLHFTSVTDFPLLDHPGLL